MGELQTHQVRIEPLSAVHAGGVFEPLQRFAIYTWIPDEPPTGDSLAWQMNQRGGETDGADLNEKASK